MDEKPAANPLPEPEPENPDDLKKQLEEAEKQKAEFLAGWQRSRADFLNYKKEEIERIKAMLEYSQEEMLLKMLPLLDNLYLAEKNLPADLKNNEYAKGFLQVKTLFENSLKEQGIIPIEASGKKFDPNFHEVVSEVEDKTKESGTIVEEVQKGYLIGERLLRPTKVTINK